MTGATGKKILLVDYEVSKMKATEDFLSQAGFDVVKAFDGLDALEKFSEEQPELVLLSAMLPKLHGFEVCKAIKHSETGRQIPVLITTSVYKSYKYKRQAMKDYLADDYILKPFNYEELLSKIREHLGLGDLAEESLEEKPDPAKVKSKSPEETDGEFDSLLDQTLETLLNKPPEKAKQPVQTKAEKKLADSNNLDEILETTLSGLLSGFGDKKASAKPPVKKKPKPEDSMVLPEELKTVEQPLPSSQELVDTKLPEAKPEPPDFEIEEKEIEPTAVESETVELPEETPEAPSKQEVAASLGFEAPDSSAPAGDHAQIETPASEESQSSDQLDKIIDEAIAIFNDEIVEDAKVAPSESAAYVVPQEPPEPQKPPEESFSEPVPGAEVRLDSGSRFGKYKLIEKIAIGGMAEMWKAKQIGPEGFEKVVALKRILPGLAENEDFITMFIDEGKVAAQLTHPNIAQIYELGETMGGYYLAMEYIAGKDLRTIMRLARKEKKNLAIPQSVIIAGKLLSGLNYAHRKKGFNNENLNIVHRDVSPQNVLISYEGEVKLVDFGIAKAAAKNSVTLTGALKGKILYMSPEQAWGQAVDRRSDVFSVGALLYEMLTGKRVFIADNEMAILQKVREWNPPPPSAANARISSKLDSIVLKAIEKDPDKRFQTAEEMREALESFIHLEKPAKKAMDLGLFMRALFKEEIRAEMPELLELMDEPIESVDPFALETLEPEIEKVEIKQIEQPAVSELPEEKPPVVPEPDRQPVEPVVSEIQSDETPEEVKFSEEALSPALVPSSVRSGESKRKSGRKDKGAKAIKASPPVKSEGETDYKPVVVQELISDKPPQLDNIVIDDDFLKPSRDSAGDNKKMLMMIGGGIGIVLIIVLLIVLMSGGDQKKESVPVVTPTPTVDAEATIAAEQTAAVIALFTETPSPSPTETETPKPATRVTRDTPIVNTPTPSPTEIPTDTPVPTQTPTPTITNTPTPTAIQVGTYIQYPDEKVKVLSQVTPDMPRAARQMNVEGRVTLKLLISETGEVLDVETLQASDQLEKSGCVKAAHDAVKKWTFQPATHQGIPVKTHTSILIPFVRK